MRGLQIFMQNAILALAITGVSSQNEICAFYGLEANCRYRIDAISLSHIRADINQCADPVEVTFTITNERPHVDFKYTFNSADTLVSVPRFTVETQLRVRLTKKEDDVINIEADFYVYGQAKADFINDDITLRGLEEHCPALNTAAKIALGVMGALAVIAAVLILLLMFMRYKRKRKREACAENQLVANAAEPGTSSVVTSLTDISEHRVTSINSASNEHHVTSINSASNEHHVTSINSASNEHHVTSVNSASNEHHVTSINSASNNEISKNNKSINSSATVDSEGTRIDNTVIIV